MYPGRAYWRTMTVKKGNTLAQKHGGEAAVKDLQHGRKFTGLAASAQAEVEADFETEGRAAMVQEQAVRLHAASRLYWDAIKKAADSGDIDALDRYCARYGWLATSSLRAWDQVKKEAHDAPGINAVDVLNVLRGDTDNETE
jgi:hypothetical protein